MSEEDLMIKLVHIPEGEVMLEGSLEIPKGAKGIVLFAHGSGSSRHSPRNSYVADVLKKHGIGILLFDLLTAEEDFYYDMRFNIDLLARRLSAATRWLKDQDEAGKLAIGYFGASTGAAAALQAAASSSIKINAIVSRGGRPDLAWPYLDIVDAPVLLIVGGNDDVVKELNQKAFDKINAVKSFEIVPGATHLFEEPGALEKVAKLAAQWFEKYLSE